MHRTILSIAIQLHYSLACTTAVALQYCSTGPPGMAEPVRQVLNFRYRTGINFSNLRTEDCSPKNPKSRRNGFEKRLPEKPASDFLGRSSRSLQMHRSRRSLKDRGGEQDAPLGRPKAPLKQTVLTILAVWTVYPGLTPGKQ